MEFRKSVSDIIPCPPPLKASPAARVQPAHKVPLHQQTLERSHRISDNMDIEHIQAFMDTPGTAAWHSAHFSDNTPYVVALQQTLVTNCTFNQCDAFTLCLSTTHPSSTGFQTLRCQRQSKQHHHRTNKCKDSP